MGNKLRFINNADEKYANCRPKLVLCNTVIRIALYAKKAIPAGTELFFYYGYHKDTEQSQDFRNPGGKEVVAVKKATKQNSKKKPHNTFSRELLSTGSAESLSHVSEKVLAATAKARAAKRMKYESKLAAEKSQATARNERVEYHNARMKSFVSRASQQGRAGASHEKSDKHRLSGHEGLTIKDSDDVIIPGPRGRSRQPVPSLTSMISVKETTEKTQTNASAKRKRPIIPDSDDEWEEP